MGNQALTISFVTQSDTAELTVDLDDVLNAAANEGRITSFIYGDEVFFRVFTKPLTGIAVTAHASGGVLTDHSVGGTIMSSVVIEEQLSFIQPPLANGGVVADNVASLEKPAYSGFVAAGLPTGASPSGSVTLDPTDAGQAVASLAGPGVYDATYTAQYWSFSIKQDTIPAGVGTDEAYPLVIVIVGA
jgi:hypothetical protein